MLPSTKRIFLLLMLPRCHHHGWPMEEDFFFRSSSPGFLHTQLCPSDPNTHICFHQQTKLFSRIPKIFCEFHSNLLRLLTNGGLFPGHLSMTIIFLNTLRNVSELIFLRKGYLTCSQCRGALFWTILICLKIFLLSYAVTFFGALPQSTSKPFFLFAGPNNMSNSIMASLDNISYLTQRFSFVKMINNLMTFLQCCTTTHKQYLM